MTQENFSAAEQRNLRTVLDLWQAIAPIREKSQAIDWQKVIAFIQQMMPLIMALLDLLPKEQQGARIQ